MSGTFAAVLLGVFLLVLGLLSVFARDFMWELTHLSNSMKGLQSERTQAWEIGSIIGGVIAIAAGIACFGAASILDK